MGHHDREPRCTLTIAREHSIGKWTTQDGIWIVGLQKWPGFKFPVHDVDLTANAVTLNGKLHAHRQEKNANRFWIENDQASLDTPGEWQIDPRRGVVQLLSPTGEPPHAGVVAIPILSELFRLENCHDVVIQNLHRGEVDDDLPAFGG